MKSRAIYYLLLVIIAFNGCGKKEETAEQKGQIAQTKIIQPVQIIGGYGLEDGQFNEPRDIAVDKDGNVYVADFRNYRVQKFDRSGNFVMKFGTKGSREGQFNDPCGIAVANDGTIVVCDTWNHRIQTFDANGNYLREWKGFMAPRGAMVSPDNRIYITDSGNNKVVIFTMNGEKLTEWGSYGVGQAQFMEPVGISLDKNKSLLYVADNDNSRIQVFDMFGNFKNAIKVDGWTAKGPREPYLDVAPDGSVFSTDPANNKIFKFSSKGNLVLTFGDKGNNPGYFAMPTGVAIDPAGFLYIADTWNHRLQKFALSQLQ